MPHSINNKPHTAIQCEKTVHIIFEEVLSISHRNGFKRQTGMHCGKTDHIFGRFGRDITYKSLKRFQTTN